MRNIKLTIQYDGTRYAGWQFQKNAKSIQEVIQHVLKKILGEKVNLIGSGRTDAGVHAKAQAANFKTRSDLPLKNMQKALNSILPKDIVIPHIEEVDLKFDAQRDAKAKIYRYTIMNNDFVDPFIRPFAAKCFYRLDINAMRRAARHLLGRHDFRSFKTKDNGIEKDTIRTVKNIKIEKDENMVYVSIEGDAFLYNMARNIVGTLIDVGRGHVAGDEVKAILLKKNRRFCGPTAAAKGLCLMTVKY